MGTTSDTSLKHGSVDGRINKALGGARRGGIEGTSQRAARSWREGETSEGVVVCPQ